MVHYSCGFYRCRQSLDEATVRKTLQALHGLQMDFFPAALWISKERRVVLGGPGDYDRALIPKEYYISEGVATLPLEGANGTSLVFTDSAQADLMPASLVVQMTDAVLSSKRWTLDHLLTLFRAVVGAFDPDHANLCDDLHARREDYRARMFDFDAGRVPVGLFWINYYGPKWVQDIGRERVEKLRPEATSVEWLDSGGVLIAIQADPYDETLSAHRERQRRLEELMDLRRLQAAFPNPGL